MTRGVVEKTVWWIVFFLYVGSGYSQRIVNSTETSVAISFDLPSYTLVTSEISEIIADYYPGEYKTVLVSDEDYGQVADPGFPAVPQLTFYVRIPFNAVNVQVSMENAQVESRSLPVGVYRAVCGLWSRWCGRGFPRGKLLPKCSNAIHASFL